MRNGQNKRMRGRNRGKGQNPLTRVYESNGPDVKIRGTASHIADKYVQLARDAQASGDPVAAENYFQHAEHYFRVIAAAQEQFRQSQPFYRPEGAADPREDTFEDGEEEPFGHGGGEQHAFGTREPQPYLPRDAQFYPQRESHGGRQQQGAPRNEEGGNVDRLPSFITGGGQQQHGHQSHGSNGHDHQGGDRFPLHRRRRRHRGGPRGDMPAQSSSAGGESDEPSPQGSNHSND